MFAQGQDMFTGQVVSEKDGGFSPVGYATLTLSKTKTSVLADSKGNFKIDRDGLKSSDTILISSVGYNTLKVAVPEALRQKKFTLDLQAQNLDNIIISNLKTQAEDGTKKEVAGYFRGWPTKNIGGEIGRMVYVESGKFKVEKIRFKMNNQCDTCVVRVRIRGLSNGVPDYELIPDSISMIVNRLSFDDKYSEFDFSNYNLVIKEKWVFVSLELLNCYNAGKPCSVCFIGTEPGKYMYRNHPFKSWEESGDSNLYLKMYYRH